MPKEIRKAFCRETRLEGLESERQIAEPRRLHRIDVKLHRPGRFVEVDLLDHLAAENGRNIVGAGNVEPFEYRGRAQYLTN